MASQLHNDSFFDPRCRFGDESFCDQRSRFSDDIGKAARESIRVLVYAYAYGYAYALRPS